MNTKSQIRKEMLETLKKQSLSDKFKKSDIIKMRLFSSKEFKKAHCVMFYISEGQFEVQTGLMIEEAIELGKKVVVPKTIVREKTIMPSVIKDPEEDLERGPFGIYQPKSLKFRPIKKEEIDLVVVPGVCFDKRCNRLGRGQGYYDNFLKDLPVSTVKVGVAFSFQVVERLPITTEDISLNKVLTDTDTYTAP